MAQDRHLAWLLKWHLRLKWEREGEIDTTTEAETAEEEEEEEAGDEDGGDGTMRQSVRVWAASTASAASEGW